MMQPLPSLNQAYRLVLQEERQRVCNNSSKLSVDYATFASNFRNSNRNYYKNTNDSLFMLSFREILILSNLLVTLIIRVAILIIKVVLSLVLHQMGEGQSSFVTSAKSLAILLIDISRSMEDQLDKNLISRGIKLHMVLDILVLMALAMSILTFLILMMNPILTMLFLIS